jgi:hypothetical protein
LCTSDLKNLCLNLYSHFLQVNFSLVRNFELGFSFRHLLHFLIFLF